MKYIICNFWLNKPRPYEIYEFDRLFSIVAGLVQSHHWSRLVVPQSCLTSPTFYTK